MKQRLLFAIKAAVSGLLIWWLFDRIDTGPVIDVLGRASAPPLIAAFAAMMLAIGFLALRWATVSRTLDIPLGKRRALHLTLIGLFFNQTLPSSIGGDGARIWFVYRDGVPLERAAICVVLDRLCALAALLLIVGLSLPMLFSLIDDPTPRWSLPLLVAFGALAFTVLYTLGGRWGAVLNRWAATRTVVALARDTRRLVAARGQLAGILALASVMHLLSILAVWLIAGAVAADITLLQSLIFVPPVVLISMVPISVAGWGVREGAMVVAFGFVGVPEADALVVSVMFGLILVGMGAPGGLLWLADGSAARRRFGAAGSVKKNES